MKTLAKTVKINFLKTLEINQMFTMIQEVFKKKKKELSIGETLSFVVFELALFLFQLCRSLENQTKHLAQNKAEMDE